MDISEIIFVSLAPILYNFIFILLWVLWFVYHKEEEDQRIHRLFKKYLIDDRVFYIITGFCILGFLYLLFSYAISNTDVDDAITTAVRAFLDGRNPYTENVVEHHNLINGTPTTVLGRYHYFPPDLLTYSLFYLLTGNILFPILGTYWFVPLHLLLLILGYWMVVKIVEWPHNRRLPFYILLTTPFLFTNSMLMLFFFLLGYYFYEIKEQHSLGMTFYVIAASVKYMVGFIIVFYFVQMIRELFRKAIPPDNWRLISKKFAPYVISSCVLGLLSLPFGLIDVIISVFAYQGLTSFRGEVAQSVGPLLIEILKILSLEELLNLSLVELFYLPLVIIIVLIAFIILWNKDTYEQILHFSMLSMLILPFYATELFITIPFYFWFKEGQKTSILKEDIKDPDLNPLPRISKINQ